MDRTTSDGDRRARAVLVTGGARLPGGGNALVFAELLVDPMSLEVLDCDFQPSSRLLRTLLHSSMVGRRLDVDFDAAVVDFAHRYAGPYVSALRAALNNAATILLRDAPPSSKFRPDS